MCQVIPSQSGSTASRSRVSWALTLVAGSGLLVLVTSGAYGSAEAEAEAEAVGGGEGEGAGEGEGVGFPPARMVTENSTWSGLVAQPPRRLSGFWSSTSRLGGWTSPRGSPGEALTRAPMSGATATIAASTAITPTARPL